MYEGLHMRVPGCERVDVCVCSCVHVCRCTQKSAQVCVHVSSCVLRVSVYAHGA